MKNIAVLLPDAQTVGENTIITFNSILTNKMQKISIFFLSFLTSWNKNTRKLTITRKILDILLLICNY